MSSLQHHVVERTRQSMEELIAAAARMPSERQTWQAMLDARPALEIVAECALVNERWAQILRDRNWMVWPREVMKAKMDALNSMEKAVGYLRSSTEAYLIAVSETPDSALDEQLVLPWGAFTVGTCLMHALWHMSYHEGQLNYIQTLYGDWSYG